MQKYNLFCDNQILGLKRKVKEIKQNREERKKTKDRFAQETGIKTFFKNLKFKF